MIRVDHFSTRTGGGAGAGARRLHEALLAEGVDSHFWHWRKAVPPTPNSHQLFLWGDGPWVGQVASRLWGRVRRQRLKSALGAQRKGSPPGLELFTAPVVGWSTPFSARRFRGGVAHLHWVAGLLDLPSFFAALPKGHPVVWTLRDMNPFTGGCHFSNGCNRFSLGCGECPQLGTPSPRDLSHVYAEIKRKSVEGVNLHVAAPARWMLEQAKNSTVFEGARSFRYIPTGVETEVFRPVDRAHVRQEIGLDGGATVIAFGSERLDNARKGVKEGLEALARVAVGGNVVALCFGQELPKDQLPPGLRVHSVGYVRDPHRLARVYAAADIFLLPSLEDNLPKTGLEALACGTPVVAFAAGGIPDFVIDGETGRLADVGDVGALTDCLRWMVEHDEARHTMGERGRDLVVERFAADAHAREYQALYQELVTPRSST